MLEGNKDIAVRFVEALSTGDAAVADRCLAPDAIAITKGFSRFTGATHRDAIVGLVSSLKELMPTGLGLKVDRVIGDGDSVAVEFEGNGRTRDGAAYHNQYVMVFTFRDGLIVQSNEYFCTRHAEEVLLPTLVSAGLLSEKGRDA